MKLESGNFIFNSTSIDGVFIIQSKKYGDNRGYFMETYKREDFIKAGISNDFIQDNQSKSKKGVIRGLHFQKTHQQAKLVRCIDGVIFDVAVDLRKDSKTYGKYVSVILSSEEGNQFFIPRGFAHGFVVLSDLAVFAYKCDDTYHPEDEGGIIYNDPDVDIKWPELEDVTLSTKDSQLPLLKDIEVKL